MKLTMTILLALAASTCLAAQRDSLLVVSWNVENFFDWKDDGASDSDRAFSADGERRWTKSRFYSKCNGIAKTLLMISSDHGRLPDAVALIEVENSFVLRQLLSSTLLRKLDYRIIHYDSPDHRGIDCALLYRRSTMNLRGSCPKHLYDSSGSIIATRDILLAEFDSLTILVNHHPSKVGGSSDSRRRVAMDRMEALCDSLERNGRRNIICVGDFNDDVWKNGGQGTIKYNGGWEKIDGCFIRGDISVKEQVHDYPALSEHDASFGGMKPRRTYSGPRYLGGLSDHYPVAFELRYK